MMISNEKSGNDEEKIKCPNGATRCAHSTTKSERGEIFMFSVERTETSHLRVVIFFPRQRDEDLHTVWAHFVAFASYYWGSESSPTKVCILLFILVEHELPWFEFVF